MSKRHPFQTPSARIAARRVPASLVLRAMLFGVLVSLAAAWAVVRHFTHVPAPLAAPVPAAAPTYDIEAGELPVPELLGPDGG